MFSVIFEVHPRPEQWDAYLGHAKMLRPELEQVDGFVDNIRYKSLTREGWILSLSGWRDEKAVVRWRTAMRPSHGAGEGPFRNPARLSSARRPDHARHARPARPSIAEQRLDETETGEGTTITLIDAKGRPDERAGPALRDCRRLGLDPGAAGLAGWDVFDAVLTPGDLILLMCWKTAANAERSQGRPRCRRAAGCASPDRARLRHVRSPRGAAILSGGGAHAATDDNAPVRWCWAREYFESRHRGHHELITVM